MKTVTKKQYMPPTLGRDLGRSLIKYIVPKSGDLHLHGTAARNLFSQPRILQRTREWVEPEKPSPAELARAETHETELYDVY